MVSLRLYLHALRAARGRQLRARARRPLARRRFPRGTPPRQAGPVPSGEALWRSDAFARGGTPDPETRLGRLHAHDGEDVLAAARAGDPEAARGLVEAWIDANPSRPGDAWHPYPLSTRAGNWVAALTLLPELGSERISESLWRQLRHLERNLEHDILGNHLIRNARALVLGGVAFAAPELTRRGIALLRRELADQVLADGGHYERSPVYHLVVLRDLLEIQAAFPHSWLEDAIERMAAFAAAVQRPDGRPPLFNDGWLDLAPRLELPEPPQGLTVLEPSGFCVVREGPLWLAFRCGPPAPEFLPAHAHADALSFQLWWHGEPVLADPGGVERGTAAHSTVQVDGRDQFPPGRGPFPEVKLRYARDGAVEASVRFGRRLRHIRRIEWGSDVVLVRDRIEGRGRHKLESRLVWAGEQPGLPVEAFGRQPLPAEKGRLFERRPREAVPAAVSVLRLTAGLPVETGFTIRLPSE